MIKTCYRLWTFFQYRVQSALSQIILQTKWSVFKIPFKTNHAWGLWTDEIKWMRSYLKPDDVMLEWGTGVSSLLFAKCVREYYSIEHNRQWYELMLKRVRKIHNLKLFHVPNNLPWEINTQDGTFADGSYAHFKDYVDLPRKWGCKFDIVLIDGRARVACAEALIPLLHSDATVFVHDFDRPEYRAVLKYYELKDQCRTLAALKLKR